jgi:hypothetical protein
VSKSPSAEFDNFNTLVDRVLSVSREEMQKRLEDYRNSSLQNTNRRGPKPKAKTASPDSDAAS